tara:strand:+ start:3236 stop:3559 length:324 start_codon:yes stop_codon:yes gene_type:complete
MSNTLKSGPSGWHYYLSPNGDIEVDENYDLLGLPELTEEDDFKYGDDATRCFKFLMVMKWYQDNKEFTHIDDTEEDEVMEISTRIKEGLAGWDSLQQLWNIHNEVEA